MRTSLVLLSSITLALSAAAAVAQERPAAAAVAAPAASMPMDCTASGMKRHDHGAERNTAQSKSCAPAQAASGAKASEKPAHDHAKFHKNQ
jgi:hypothetical protein